MSGDWIKFEIATPDKPEIWTLASSLEIDPDAVVGKMLRIWAWFDQHTEKGNAASVTKLLLDRTVGVTGFCNAVIGCGWMLEADNMISLPNFDRHNGKTAKNRAVTAKRVAAHKAKSNAVGNAEVTLTPLPKEEKRREEKSNTTTQGDKPPAPKFTKPTLDQLITEFSGRVANPEGEAKTFLGHYESNGWKVGRNPMKSWQHAVTNWISRGTTNAQYSRTVKPSKGELNDQAMRDYFAELDRQDALAGNGLGSLAQPPLGL
jgi:hypothetical protein